MTINSITNSQMSSAMTKLSNMQRINSAADDAAGLAIMEKMESQIKGLEQGTENTMDMQNLVKTAESSLSTIGDSLQRIRELSIQAANGVYGDDDLAILQDEVSQLVQGISDTAKSSTFNTMNLLDGTFSNKLTASSPDGSGMMVSIPDMSSMALGLENYDISGEFDISLIDNIMSQVNGVRSDLGAMSNRFDHTINSNSVMMLNQMAAKSRIADLDIGKAASDSNRERVLNEMAVYTQKQQMDQMQGSLSVQV